MNGIQLFLGHGTRQTKCRLVYYYIHSCRYKNVTAIGLRTGDNNTMHVKEEGSNRATTTGTMEKLKQ